MKAKDIYHYLLGNYRYKIYYSKWFGFLMRTHIREQIDFRIKVMDKECYEQGECKLCGCSTTALQMANKMCEKPCYPKMMTEDSWKSLKPILNKLYETKERYNEVMFFMKMNER